MFSVPVFGLPENLFNQGVYDDGSEVWISSMNVYTSVSSPSGNVSTTVTLSDDSSHNNRAVTAIVFESTTGTTPGSTNTGTLNGTSYANWWQTSFGPSGDNASLSVYNFTGLPSSAGDYTLVTRCQSQARTYILVLLELRNVDAMWAALVNNSSSSQTSPWSNTDDVTEHTSRQLAYGGIIDRGSIALESFEFTSPAHMILTDNVLYNSTASHYGLMSVIDAGVLPGPTDFTGVATHTSTMDGCGFRGVAYSYAP